MGVGAGVSVADGVAVSVGSAVGAGVSVADGGLVGTAVGRGVLVGGKEVLVGKPPSAASVAKGTDVAAVSSVGIEATAVGVASPPPQATKLINKQLSNK